MPHSHWILPSLALIVSVVTCDALQFRFPGGTTVRRAATDDVPAAPFSAHEVELFRGPAFFVSGDSLDSDGEKEFRVVYNTTNTLVGVHVDSEASAVITVDPRGAVHALVRDGSLVTRIFPQDREYGKSVTNIASLPDEAPPRRLPLPLPASLSMPTTTRTRRRRSALHQVCPDTTSVIRVGVLHTMDAKNEDPGGSTAIELNVRAAITEANTIIYPMSGINIRLELCVNTLTSFQAETWPVLTLDKFSRSRIVDRARGYNRCDVMVLYSALAGLGGSVCGIGDLPGSHSVVAGACFVDNFSFAHELAHNMNACHGTPPGPDCANGYNAFANSRRSFRSIMAYRAMCSTCPRVARFSSSNTSLVWMNGAIGDAEHDNAAALNNNKHTLSRTGC